MKKLLSFAGLFSLIILSSCVSTGPERAKLGRFAKGNDQEDRLHRARSLHDMGEFDAAISQIRTLIDASTYSSSLDRAYELLIEWLLEIRQDNEAKRLASYFIANHKNSPSVNKIIPLFKKGSSPEAPPTTASPESVTTTPPESPKDENTSEDFLLELEKISANSESKTQLSDFILTAAPISSIEKIWAAQKSRPATGLSGARLAFHYFHLGELAKAYDISAKAFTMSPPHIQNELVSLQRKIDNLRKVAIDTVGILLPLSGPFASFGKKALGAMSIGFAIPMPLTEPKINIFTAQGLKIIVADSAADPAANNDLVDKMATEYACALIIGDISTDPSISAALRSHQYGIPILSLSRHPMLVNLGDDVFSFNSSAEQKIDTLVSYAIQEQKHNNFAIIFPRHNYGISMAKLFYESVIKNKGHISAMESYDTHQTTFSETARKLVGTHFLYARNDYTICQKEAQLESNRLAREAALKVCKDGLKPVVDFDAIFVPEYQALSFLVPALVQADILLTNNPSAKKSYAASTKIENPKAVQMLGPSSWNDATVIKRFATQVNGAVFVDAFDPLSPDFVAFNNAFSALNIGMPSSLEIFAHDAAKLAKELLLTIVKDPTTEKNRHTVRQRLRSFNKKIGLLENISFAKNELHTPLISFEIMNGLAKPLVSNKELSLTGLENETTPSLPKALSRELTKQTLAQKN